MKRKKDIRRFCRNSLLILLIFIMYVMLGALIPFAFPHKENEEVIASYKVEDYYSEDISSDMAYIVEDNKEALDIRLKMFEEAKESIIISTFDIREGESFSDMAASLLSAADRGVEVKILVDGMYGMLHMGSKDIFYALGVHDNVIIKYYNTPNLLMPWTANGRMHDKYIIVDDKLLLAGGRNTFDYFLGEYEGKGTGYDREVLIYNKLNGLENNSVITEVEAYFNELWNENECKTRFNKASLFNKKDVEKEENKLKVRYDNICKSNRNEAINYEDICVNVNKITFVHNPTHIYSKEPLVWYQMKVLMMNAKDRVIVQTPYAVFSDEMYNGMSQIVERVPNTKLLINSIAVGDNIMASSDYIENKSDILDTGVKVYEFAGEHSCHAKSLIIDDEISVVGSYNFDMRSTYLDTETMFVIHGEEFTKLLEENFNAIEVLSVLADYDVHAVSIPKSKKTIIRIISKATQLVRFLI